MLYPDKIKKIIVTVKNNQFFIPIILLIVGIFVLVFLGSSSGKEKTKKTEIVNTTEYIETLENNLQKNIKKLASVQDCSVMITISSLEDNEYLENKSITSSLGEKNEEYSREEEYLVIDDGGDDSVVIKSRKMPAICGALVVYDGNDDIQTKKNILDAVSTVLGIQSNKVCVVSNQE